MVEHNKKYAHFPLFDDPLTPRTFDEIPVYSRPAILIIKFQYFPGCERTLLQLSNKPIIILLFVNYSLQQNVNTLDITARLLLLIIFNKAHSLTDIL